MFYRCLILVFLMLLTAGCKPSQSLHQAPAHIQKIDVDVFMLDENREGAGEYHLNLQNGRLIMQSFAENTRAGSTAPIPSCGGTVTTPKEKTLSLKDIQKIKTLLQQLKTTDQKPLPVPCTPEKLITVVYEDHHKQYASMRSNRVGESQAQAFNDIVKILSTP